VVPSLAPSRISLL